ncbi:MAG TPA: GT4 family glycosyltransferase PelF [Polyangiales bacterium]|nr:GT4 family glycosyltransferase PelF [Polyangiales bacterium]
MKLEADVCLLLEGTYPFVRGGVSSWVHQLLTGMPELTFSLVFVGGRRRDYGERRYQLPQNVVHLETHYLEDGLRHSAPKPTEPSRQLSAESDQLHDYLAARAGRNASSDAKLARLEHAVDAALLRLERPGGLQLEHFLCSEAAWEHMRRAHQQGDPDASFIDYFWTLRLLHAPIFQLAKIAAQAPRARVYHSVSTGYAGFLGALLERHHGRPLILSEHGIYTKERRIDLNQAEWFDQLGGAQQASLGDASLSIRKLWIRYFESLGRLTYRAANPIISLYEGNRERQILDGADSARTRVIVNGIDVQRFHGALESRSQTEIPRVIGLIGRVVPIKDVKTFLRSLQLTAANVPDVEGWIVGGEDEDPGYAQECRALARSLGIESRVKFLGHRNVAEILPQLGLLMLTSISEAQPLAILEAFAAGVPCVATDVGACREQIEGRGETDRALGRAGRIAPFADAHALAQAATELLSNASLWRSCQGAGLARVQRFYAESAMLEAYRGVYLEALEE